MTHIKTYQDLLAVGENEQNRMQFCLTLINEHKASREYRRAADAKLYYQHENPTIMRAQKLVHNIYGQAVPDVWSANNKIPSRYYYYFVTQLTQYLLGNGVTFGDPKTKDKLGGDDFDYKVQKAATFAQNSGVGYLFYNLDHVEVFDFLEFAPLVDEFTASVMAGVRFWQLEASKPLMFTLYEIDGYTDYRQIEGKLENVHEKRPYKINVTTTAADGEVITGGENYPTFPIVPLYNINQQSELVGMQNTLDGYDLVASQLVNNVDDGNLIYWALKNCGGMSELDAEQFLERVKMTHVAMMPNADEGATAEPHTIEAPIESNEVALERLRKQLFSDAMALDVTLISGGAITATQIKAAYEPLNNKADAFEYQVTKCIKGILGLAGVDDVPTYTRSKIANIDEEIRVLVESAEYLPSDYITQKILEFLGDGDKAQEIIAQLEAEELSRFPTTQTNEGEEYEE